MIFLLACLNIVIAIWANIWAEKQNYTRPIAFGITIGILWPLALIYLAMWFLIEGVFDFVDWITE